MFTGQITAQKTGNKEAIQMRTCWIYFRKLNKALFVATLSIIVIIMAGCSSNGGSGSTSSAPGTLGISMTDAPACGFDEVNVTVSKVRVHQSSSATENDAGWTDITLTPARKINLLDLANGALEELGQTPLAAGHYTQLRLVLNANTGSSIANSVVTSGTTTEIALITPSAVQSGIKLINEFDVAAGQRVDLLLDFDACRSVVKRGNGSYLLRPVINVIPFVLNGIEGYVATSLTGSNVAVSAQVNGTVVRSTAPNPQTGEFFLARLDAPASYDVVITADGRATAVIAGVPVLNTTSTTTVSTSAAPISLPTSTTGTISGTVTLNPLSPDVIAYVATKQTFTPGGPMVTVKSEAVDQVGNYSLVLPVAAPLLGHYGTGSLPIAFTDQFTVAGKYSVEVSAIGYVTQSIDKDISTTDQTQDFTLVP
jgi:hypothetical protein